MSKRHQYQLTLATAVGMTEDESHRCLRAMLKAMLRQWDCRCLSVIAVNATGDAQDEPQQPNTATNAE